MKVLPRRRRAVLLNLVLALGLAGGVGAAYAVTSSSSSAPKSNSSTSTATVQRGTVLATVSGSGSLVSPSDAGLDFTTGGTLTEVDVKAGDHVTKGQVLAKVDRTNAKATLAQAKANLSSAEAQLTSAEEGTTTTTSSGQGGTPTTSTTVSATAVASAKAQVAQAKASVTSAQDALDGTVLKATVSGTVASVGGKVGDTVSGGSNSSGASTSSGSSSSSVSGFVVITNPAGMEVTADFSETDALKLKKGQGATVTLNAESDKTLNAKVVSVSSLPVSSSSGAGSSSSAVQYEAVLKITSSTGSLRTGLSATVSVATGVAGNALYLPTAAVSGTGTSRRVNVVNSDGSVSTTTVTTGVEGTSGIQIVSGLTEGQKVQYTVVSSTGSGGFPGGGFPGGGFPGGGAGGGSFPGGGAAGARGGRG